MKRDWPLRARGISAQAPSASDLGQLARDHAFVVPAYGESPFLAGCLASLRAQTTQSRVVITTSTPSRFVDDAADAAGVEVITNPTRAGIAGDFNFALRASSARFVTLAHQDDVYMPGFLEQTLAAFARHAGAAICFTSHQEIDDRGRPTSTKVSRAKHLLELLTLGRLRVVRGVALRAFLAFGDPLPCSSVTFDMSELPDFAFSDTYAANLDWDAWWSLRAAGHTFVRVPARLVGSRHNELTETAKLLRNGVRRSEDLAMFRRIWPRPISDLIAAVYRLGY